MTFVDTNVLLDLVNDDPTWSTWSAARLYEASRLGALVVSDIVYAELAVRYARIEDLEAMLREARITHEPTPREALFVAAKAYELYRRRGGRRETVLPDFFIGAHAAFAGAALLTRDPKPYRSYFPTVSLIAP